MSRAGVPQCVAIAFALLLVQACSNDAGDVLPVGPNCPRTGIAGVVTLAGRPAAADLRVLPAGSRYWDGNGTRGITDLTGRFFLPLPAGRYLLSVSGGDLSTDVGWSARGPVVSSERPDTLIVEDGRETVANFRFGLAKLAITLPELMKGTYYTLQFYRWPVTTGQHEVGHASASGRAGLQQMTAGLPIGVYAVKFTASSFIGGTWMPGTPSPGAADSIVVPDGESILYPWTPCPGVASLRGSVHGSWEHLADDYNYRPEVRVFTEDSLRLVSTNVEDNGTFRFQFLDAQRVRLAVRVAEIERWMGGETFADAETFVLTPDQETVAPPFTESGLIVRLAHPVPWTDLDPLITLLDAGGHSYLWTAVLGHADVVLVPNLAGGMYKLWVAPRLPSAADWLPQWYDGADSAAAATPVAVPSDGSVATVTVQLEIGGQIRGRVLGGDGRALREATVLLTRADRPACWGALFPGVDGIFTLRGIPDGSWKIGARPARIYSPCRGPDPSQWIWYGGATWDSAAVVSVRDHGTVDGIEIRFP